MKGVLVMCPKFIDHNTFLWLDSMTALSEHVHTTMLWNAVRSTGAESRITTMRK